MLYCLPGPLGVKFGKQVLFSTGYRHVHIEGVLFYSGDFDRKKPISLKAISDRTSLVLLPTIQVLWRHSRANTVSQLASRPVFVTDKRSAACVSVTETQTQPPVKSRTFSCLCHSTGVYFVVNSNLSTSQDQVKGMRSLLTPFFLS